MTLKQTLEKKERELAEIVRRLKLLETETHDKLEKLKAEIDKLKESKP